MRTRAKWTRWLALMAIPLVAPVANLKAAQAPPSPAEVRVVAQKAYLFTYPLVLMEMTRRNATAGGDSAKGAPINEFRHTSVFPGADSRQVIRPNADTLYSSAWVDLTKEPVLLHLPDTRGRYYLVQMMDAWTETFAVPGKRTTGTKELWFALVGPGWNGGLPPNVERLDSTTNSVWLLGRIQTNTASDYGFVQSLQQGFQVMPLSRYPDGLGRRPVASQRPPAVMTGQTPPQQVEAMTASEFFTLANQLMVKNPPHVEDAPLVAELDRIGIAPGRRFDPSSLGAEGEKALVEGVLAATKILSVPLTALQKPGPTGWSSGTGSIGRYGTNYTNRAYIARFALGANPREDAVYISTAQDRDGKPLTGQRSYVMHFERSQLPRVKAFWSVTMYNPEGYFAKNSLNRHAIGDRDSLRYNTDGSLDLYLQATPPGPDKESNWLPAPEGGFNLMLRLYWPGEEILSGRWLPPAVTPR